MFNKTIRLFFSIFILNLILIKASNSEIITDIQIIGNDRISKETIIMFSEIDLKDDLNTDILNKIIKNLYKTDFFENVSVKYEDKTLFITVKENPIIQKVKVEGIKANKIKKIISSNIKLKSRSSYNELNLLKDKENIKKILKELGYYFPTINTFVEKLNDNKINLTYDIDLGKKAKIRKITFI